MRDTKSMIEATPEFQKAFIEAVKALEESARKMGKMSYYINLNNDSIRLFRKIRRHEIYIRKFKARGDRMKRRNHGN